jgi:hypothetical protein
VYRLHVKSPFTDLPKPALDIVKNWHTKQTLVKSAITNLNKICETDMDHKQMPIYYRSICLKMLSESVSLLSLVYEDVANPQLELELVAHEHTEKVPDTLTSCLGGLHIPQDTRGHQTSQLLKHIFQSFQSTVKFTILSY